METNCQQLQKISWLWITELSLINLRGWQALGCRAASQLAAESKCSLVAGVGKFRTALGASARPVVIFLFVCFVLVSNSVPFQAVSGVKTMQVQLGRCRTGYSTLSSMQECQY